MATYSASTARQRVRWSGSAAAGVALAYGGLRLAWVLGDRPWLPPWGDDLLGFSDWGVVVLCAAAAGAAVLIGGGRLRGTAQGAVLLVGAVAALGLVAASAVLLVDVVGLLLPGSGVPFHAGAFVSRLGCLAVAAAAGLVVVLAWRERRGRCLACGRDADAPPAPVAPSRVAFAAAYTVVAAFAVRVGAQVVGEASTGGTVLEVGGATAAVALLVGFVLAGMLLPLALVHAWGRTWPRWVPGLAGRRVPRWLVLGPGAFLALGMTVYFAVSAVHLVFQPGGATAGTPYPTTFFWVTVPAYLVWGVGLSVAAQSYWRRTRPRCRVCGRPEQQSTAGRRPLAAVR